MKKGCNAAVAIALLVLAQGCAVKPPEEEEAQSNTQSREQQLHDRWSGRDYSELKSEWGDPIHEMTIPRYGWPNSQAVLYGRDEESGCVDAFLIIRGEERTWVEEYFCR